MGLLRSPLGLLSVIVLLTVTLVLGFAVWRVDSITHPDRPPSKPLDFELLRMDVKDVELQSPDGIRLAAWLIRGRPDRPAIVLAHGLGSNKTALANLASVLMQDGFTLMLLDFRGHGESEPSRSTLGINERRDLLATIDYLLEHDLADRGRIGLYGVGMGAHAAALAAEESPHVKVLVLDGMPPDAEFLLGRQLFGNWRFGCTNLAFLGTAIFATLSQAHVSEHRAADVFTRLLGREVLLIGSNADPRMAEELKTVYETIPQQTDVDGNLVLLASTQSNGLYGEGLTVYNERVAGFFRSRLITP